MFEVFYYRFNGRNQTSAFVSQKATQMFWSLSTESSVQNIHTGDRFVTI